MTTTAITPGTGKMRAGEEFKIVSKRRCAHAARKRITDNIDKMEQHPTPSSPVPELANESLVVRLKIGKSTMHMWDMMLNSSSATVRKVTERALGMNSLRIKHRGKLSQEEVIKALVDELEKLDDEHWALKRTSTANIANTAKLEALEEEMMTLKDSRGVDKVLTESLRVEVHFLEEENLIQVGCISSLRRWLEEEKKKSQQSKAKADAVGVSHKKDIDRLKSEKRKAEEELEATKGKLKRIKDALEGSDLKSEGKM